MPSDYLFDEERHHRVGLHEAVLCAHKSIEQIAAAIDDAMASGQARLFTRLSADAVAALPDDLRDSLDYDPLSQTATVGEPANAAEPARTAIVTAGTSDKWIAAEAIRTLAHHGETARLFQDLGVAGLWRLLRHEREIASYPVVIAIAGMEGALFSVLAGLVPGAVIAVPSSTGSGVATAGRVALDSALASCAPGLTVVNIDNGYGAACAALRLLRQIDDAVSAAGG